MRRAVALRAALALTLWSVCARAELHVSQQVHHRIMEMAVDAPVVPVSTDDSAPVAPASGADDSLTNQAHAAGALVAAASASGAHVHGAAMSGSVAHSRPDDAFGAPVPPPSAGPSAASGAVGGATLHAGAVSNSGGALGVVQLTPAAAHVSVPLAAASGVGPRTELLAAGRGAADADRLPDDSVPAPLFRSVLEDSLRHGVGVKRVLPRRVRAASSVRSDAAAVQSSSSATVVHAGAAATGHAPPLAAASPLAAPDTSPRCVPGSAGCAADAVVATAPASATVAAVGAGHVASAPAVEAGVVDVPPPPPPSIADVAASATVSRPSAADLVVERYPDVLKNFASRLKVLELNYTVVTRFVDMLHKRVQQDLPAMQQSVAAVSDEQRAVRVNLSSIDERVARLTESVAELSAAIASQGERTDHLVVLVSFVLTGGLLALLWASGLGSRLRARPAAASRTAASSRALPAAGAPSAAVAAAPAAAPEPARARRRHADADLGVSVPVRSPSQGASKRSVRRSGRLQQEL